MNNIITQHIQNKLQQLVDVTPKQIKTIQILKQSVDDSCVDMILYNYDIVINEDTFVHLCGENKPIQIIKNNKRFIQQLSIGVDCGLDELDYVHERNMNDVEIIRFVQCGDYWFTHLNKK